MKSKLSLIYFSATDATKKVLYGIASGMAIDFTEYDVTLPITRKKLMTEHLTFDEDDILVIGVPVYSGRVPELLLPLLSDLKGKNTKTVFVVTYGGRAYDDALLELKNILESNGFLGIAGGAFIGEHSLASLVAAGRPDQDDLDKANEFGKEIMKKITSLQTGKTENSLKVSGHFPYVLVNKKGLPMAPSTKVTCISCGICATDCPMGVISKVDFKTIEAEGCVHCCRCVKRCPQHAKIFTQEAMQNTEKWLISNFSNEKNIPELFL